MMKNIIHLIAVGIIGLFSACQDITVGYLEADAAKYTIDTLHIINANKELQKLKDIEADFYSNTQELQDAIAELNDRLDYIYDEEYDIAMDEAFEEAEANDPNFWDDFDKVMQLQEEVEERLGIPALEAEIEEKSDYLENLAIEMGIGSLAILQKQIQNYQEKIDFKLPWTSSAIEGVQGTQPLLFSIIGVKSNNAEAAAKFMDHAGVLGDGTIYVDLDVDVPPGNYTVSLKIENEGRTRILEDAFTFVVEAEIPVIDSDSPNEK